MTKTIAKRWCRSPCKTKQATACVFSCRSTKSRSCAPCSRTKPQALAPATVPKTTKLENDKQRIQHRGMNTQKRIFIPWEPQEAATSQADDSSSYNDMESMQEHANDNNDHAPPICAETAAIVNAPQQEMSKDQNLQQQEPFRPRDDYVFFTLPVCKRQKVPLDGSSLLSPPLEVENTTTITTALNAPAAPMRANIGIVSTSSSPNITPSSTNTSGLSFPTPCPRHWPP